MACTKARIAKAAKLAHALAHGLPVAHLTAARAGKAKAALRRAGILDGLAAEAREEAANLLGLNFSLGTPLGAGVEARYWQIDATQGMKAYRDRLTRDSAYRAQRKAAAAGIGPKLLGRFEASINGERCYCVLTEHVPKMGNRMEWRVQAKAHEFLKKRVKEVFGKAWTDAHPYNYAAREDGTPLVIDFGSHSFNVDHEAACDTVRVAAKAIRWLQGQKRF